jgi:hypothetical protein
MVWVVFAAVVIAFVVLAWAATRGGSGSRVSVREQADLPRSGLALLAASIALVAAVVAYADQTIEFPPIVGILAIAAITALALALVPSHHPWSDGRRQAAAIVACVWVAVGLALWPFAVMVSACACGGGGPGYVPPAPLGIAARGWITMAILGGPVLLLLAASRLPDRLRRAAA